jgi:hypothetical protein
VGFAQTLANTPGPVYAIGASHSQTNLVNYAGVGKQVDFFIDDDTAKVGLFPPVAETRNAILSSAQFEATAKGGTLIKTGFGYEKWMQKLCALALARGMTVLDPKDFIQKLQLDRDSISVEEIDEDMKNIYESMGINPE